MVASLLPKEQNLSVKNDNPVADAFLAAMKVPIGLKDENARLKEEIAALKGETPEDEPDISDHGAYHIKDGVMRVRGNAYSQGYVLETYEPGKYELDIESITEFGSGRPVGKLTIIVE